MKIQGGEMSFRCFPEAIVPGPLSCGIHVELSVHVSRVPERWLTREFERLPRSQGTRSESGEHTGYFKHPKVIHHQYHKSSPLMGSLTSLLRSQSISQSLIWVQAPLLNDHILTSHSGCRNWFSFLEGLP